VDSRAHAAPAIAEHGAFAKNAPVIAAKAVAAAGEQTVTLATETISARWVGRFAHDLLDLDRQIKDFDKQIVERLSAHQHAKRITSVGGDQPEHVLSTGQSRP
jgi:hypothetical protein